MRPHWFSCLETRSEREISSHYSINSKTVFLFSLQICLELFNKAYEVWKTCVLIELQLPQALMPLCQSLPLIVSGLRCLALSCPSQIDTFNSSVHARLFDLFAGWAEAIITLLNCGDKEVVASTVEVCHDLSYSSNVIKGMIVSCDFVFLLPESVCSLPSRHL